MSANGATASAATQRDAPNVIWSWALYDWANSAFTTLVVTFIYSTYFTKAMAPDEVTGTAWWSRAIAVSALLTALLSPVLGAAADRAGARKRFLAATTALCVTATAALAFVAPGGAGTALLALVLFVLADWAFETGYTFYNAFLPAIASPARIGRVSGYGWGLGYVGGLACMAVALVGFVQPEVPWFGLSRAEGWNVRATNLLVALWYLVFALPLFLFVPEQRAGAVRVDARGTLAELRQTMRSLGRYREVVKFLVARLIFNDGLVTIFAFGGIYAAGTFGMTLDQVILFGIALNVASGLGAAVFGYLDDKLGGKTTIMVTLVALSVATVLAVWAPDTTWLWVAGLLIGLFVGPNQSASRSLMARFVPERHQAEFFGFFQLSGKATSFLGPILLGTVAQLAGSQRAGVATVLAFFVVGGLLLVTVNEKAGIAAAGA
ncbi:MAG: MFS transporter [Gemmatimonadetes bacterium GWC2_71_10]|nr:MAG: MFS transporter [Gemmatimonadetes bacterium GWC2_71_10]